MANFKKSINLKLLTFLLAASLATIGFNASAKVVPDNVIVPSISSTVSTNMLDVNNAVITQAKVENLFGKDQEIRVHFSSLPTTSDKIFAVLVDEIAGGVIESKFVENGFVSFSKIPEYIKIPGIHLYRNSQGDPDFLIRSENFIASTSYLMPYAKKIKENGGWINQNYLPAIKGNGIPYGDSVPDATLYTTTVPNVYSLALPADLLEAIGEYDLKAEDIFAVVIADDYDGSPVNVHGVVSTDYGELASDPAYLSRIEFLLPNNVTKFQVHLYKKGLYEENFLCKFLGDINKEDFNKYIMP